MGRFPIADEELAKVWICKRCKARNRAGATKCRKCGYRYLRPKKRELAPKK
jgi:large subunit ribosomal protein L40e